MKTINQFMLAVVMGAVMLMPLAQANEMGGDGPKGMREGRHAAIFAQLGLSEDQKSQLEANKRTQKGEIKSLFEEMMSLSKQLNQEMMKPTVDMNAVNNLNAKIKTVQGQLADKRVASILEVRKILTPEQFNKFITLTEELRSKRRAQREENADKK